MMAGAGLGDPPAEQTLAAVPCQQRADTHRTGRLAEHGHVRRVAAEPADVVAHPFEGGHLVEDAGIAAPRGVGEQLVEVEEPERVEAVVQRHEDDVVAHEGPAVVER